MTEEEQNRAIAEACGWVDIHHVTKTSGLVGTAPSGWPAALPDYLHDLNAMHEAEKHVDYMKYYEELCVADKSNLLVGYRHLWHSDARTRAEAFLKAKRLWKD